MILTAPLPFEEAIASKAVRTLLPTELRTDLLETIKPELLARSRFSAGVTEVEFLQRAFDGVDALAAGTTDRATQRAELKQLLDSLSYRPAEGEADTLTDLSSDARLNLILDTNVQMMQGAGAHLQAQDPAVRDMWPAKELVRVIDSKEPRDWPQRFRDAATAVGDTAALQCLAQTGRMAAKRDSRVWYALSRFGQPHAPYDFGSGMDDQDIDRDTAIELGLIDRDEQIRADDLNINGDLQATPQVREAALKTALSDELSGVAEFSGGVLRLITRNRDSSLLALSSELSALSFVLNTRSYERDQLGRFAGDGGSLSIADNITRGKKALSQLRRDRAGAVPVALQVPGLGDVEIPWGRAGHTAPDAKGQTHTDGYGLSHIIAKHGDAAAEALPEVLAKGTVRRHSDPAKREITHGKWKAIVGKDRKTSAWAITNFEEAR